MNVYTYVSPPTQVIWEKNREVIHFNNYSVYHFSKEVYDRPLSDYCNILTITASSIEDLIGEYSYAVVNSIGSDKSTITVQGLVLISCSFYNNYYWIQHLM